AVGVAIDHDAGKVEFAHAAFELVRRRPRILHGDMAEAAITVRPFRDLGGEEVIGGGRCVARPWYHARPARPDPQSRARRAQCPHRPSTTTDAHRNPTGSPPPA